MLTRPLRSALLVFATLLLALGCTSIEGQCQQVCEWEARCVSGSVGVEDCSQQCVNDNDQRSTDCQDAFDQFATCAAANESCQSVNKQCGSEANSLVQKCDCTNPKGALAELCGMAR